MLSNRLKEVLKLINGSKLVDVGCDHGYLSIEAIRQSKVEKAVCVDVAEQPLESAKSNIEKYKLTKEISTILSNGLENVKGKFDVLAIAGLGQNTICDILKNGEQKLPKTIVICSNTISDEIRKFLSKKYKLEYEDVIVDKGKYYELMKFDKKNGMPIKNFLMGDINFRMRTETIKDYWSDNLKKFELKYKHEPSDELLKKIEMIKMVVNYEA